jgi:putative flippase GtrA
MTDNQKNVKNDSELWKFIKFSFAGASSSIVELAVHLLLTGVVFKALMDVPFVSPVFNYIGINSKGYLNSYLISITVGYAIAFILNRKVTFHADSNATVSVVLYILMVIFTIFAGSWIGTVMSGFSVTLIDKGWSGTVVNAVCKIIQMTIPTLWTYPINRFVIHRKVKTPDTGEEKNA